MSAIVCGKRSNAIFEELPPAGKRVRCSPVHQRLSLPLTSSPSANPNPLFGSLDRDEGSRGRILDRLRSIFPGMDQEILERALEACGSDLDSAIRSLNDLRLESAGMKLSSTASTSETGVEINVQSSATDFINSNGENPVSEVPLASGVPRDGSEWVELFVREMMDASDVNDARARASRALEVLEKSIVARIGTESIQNFHKESAILKEQVETLIRENSILKRAVAIQHEKQREYDERNQEVQHLKQLVSQYQEQLRTLEVNNYALTMHLKQAQQNSSIPGRFHPDIF